MLNLRLENVFKNWDFHTFEELTGYCYESYLNGQKAQARAIYRDLAEAVNRNQIIEHLIELGADKTALYSILDEWAGLHNWGETSELIESYL